MLFDAGAVNRLGKVDDGTTVTDYDDEEIARKHTLGSSLAWVEWNKTKINIVDTPGHGQLPQRCPRRAAGRPTRRWWSSTPWPGVAGADRGGLERGRRARPAAVRRAEPARPRARQPRPRALESLRAVFGRAVVPITIPIGEEQGFAGVVDLVGMKAVTFKTDGSGAVKAGRDPRRRSRPTRTARPRRR